jgi:chromosomal replication initiator protein
MRVAILLKKAHSEGVHFSDDVAFFVAKHLRSMCASWKAHCARFWLTPLPRQRHHDRCRERSAERLLSVQNRQISVENIQKTVADFFNIKVADMYSKKRPANIARPRQIAMYLAKELTQKSLPEIGELFGGRDHTTVHAVRKITADRAKNPSATMSCMCWSKP